MANSKTAKRKRPAILFKLVSTADGVVSGSFVCKSTDFNSQIIKLKNNLKIK